MRNFTEHKPTILIMTQNGELESHWSQVLFGMEEEGIPYQIKKGKADYSIEEQAYEAAHQSALAVGIASTNEEIVVHYKNLSKQQPLFRKAYHDVTNPFQLRNIGCNAARLVKGIPFKINE
ncbi:glycerol dehydratase reactivase beta/small subunit family protein [Vibrio sp. DW001]|uniref:glycerol dehydratase reactivase beta/small subunit family protein n=1 Tax=Vibrio sp. DW001 TaxID=2912315 RepID=UPI0023AE96AF|nr:glycerol dehydratase reactivase beta/small subunit family protein [Vibrio sp. DW001]WED28698.1 glycerol dehydratase reactivase beta/small subunit family protein [Vibrio sp. DW001]